MITKEEIAEYFSSPSLPVEGAIHFIGIGGAGMSGIARVLAQNGRVVTGSDEVESETVRELRAGGIAVHIGHDPSNIGNATAVVVTDAITPTKNSEFMAAVELGLPLLRRSQALAELLRNRFVIAVTGSHGKSTTTAILGQIVADAGVDPLVIVGANVPGFDGNVRHGKGNVAVVEACEAYSGIDDMQADIVLLTNLEEEHMDHYVTRDNLMDTMLRFARRAEKLVYCKEDAGAREIGEQVSGSIPYAVSEAVPGGSIRIIGQHNRVNVAGAVAAAAAFGLPPASAIASASNAVGPMRRLELIANERGITVIDDYAHHPTEIEKSLTALREEFPGRRLVVVYQPHMYSRTQKHLEDFAPALGLADHVVVTDIYPAREPAIPGVSAALIVERLEGRGLSCDYVPSRHLLPRHVERLAMSGDVVVGMGAGTIESFTGDFLAELRRGPKLRVAVFAGGESVEREVSLCSGTMVVNALRSKGYEVVEMDPTELLLLEASVRGLMGVDRPDIVFNALHGTGAEDGKIQGLLELLHIPYTGSGLAASALAMDKQATKRILSTGGLPVPEGIVVSRVDDLPAFPLPCVVKPNAQGSTIGITFVTRRDDLAGAVARALKYDSLALIEELVEGIEISVPVLGGRALPVVEICPRSGTYDYQAKYTEGATDEIIPARIDSDAASTAQEYALRAHEMIGADDFSRTDMIVTQNRVVVLEINTVPGLTNTSLLPNSAQAAGIPYDELCEQILQHALKRYGIEKTR